MVHRGNAQGLPIAAVTPPCQPATGTLPTVGQAPGTNPANHGNRGRPSAGAQRSGHPAPATPGALSRESHAASVVPGPGLGGGSSPGWSSLGSGGISGSASSVSGGGANCGVGSTPLI